MEQTVEQIGKVRVFEDEKDLGEDDYGRPMIVIRVYSDVKVRVPEALLEDAVEPIGIYCSNHQHQVRKDSELHRVLAEKYHNHRGWGRFGVISQDGDVLHIEWRGY